MNIETVNELITSLESAGELSIKERKYLELAKAYVQLAAENVGLKAAISAVNRTAEECEVNGDELKYVVEPAEFEALTDLLDDTHATDRIYAGIKADGVEEMASTYRGFANEDGCSVNMKCSYNLTAERAESYAAYIRRQLRAEALGSGLVWTISPVSVQVAESACGRFTIRSSPLHRSKTGVVGC